MNFLMVVLLLIFTSCFQFSSFAENLSDETNEMVEHEGHLKGGLSEAMHEVNATRKEAMQEERALRDQIKEAMQAGDKDKVKELKSQLKAMHKENVNDMQESRKEAREAFKDRRNELKEKREEGKMKRKEFRDKMEDVRDKREDLRDNAEDVRDAKHDGGLRDKLEDRRDKREDWRDKREDKRDQLRGGHSHQGGKKGK